MGECYVLKEGRLAPSDPESAFPFLKEPHHVVSLVGAGGKTSLMYALAEQAGKRGRKTAVSTTTHIAVPEHAESREAWPEHPEVLRFRMGQGVTVYGRPVSEEKLGSLQESLFCEIIEESEFTLLEADGAKRMCCKVPAEHEPVLLPQSDIVIGVLGLDAVGRRIEDCCFRTQHAVRLLKKPEWEILTEEDLALILTSEDGTRKNVGSRSYFAVLNKADTEERRKSGERILRLLAEVGQTNAAVTKLR